MSRTNDLEIAHLLKVPKRQNHWGMRTMAEAQKQTPSLEDLCAQREEILRLAAKYGASNVRVVGSVARGEAGPESDVDFLVTVREGVSIFDLVGLWLDMKGLLDCEVSLISDETPDERFLSRIQQDAVAL